MRAPAPALQPQVPAAPSKATLASPPKLVALKSFRDRLQRAQANAAQARNAVVLKPAVGQSQPQAPFKAPTLPAFPRPAHRNEPSRLESPGSPSKLLALPPSRPEPKPMAEARPQLAVAKPPRPQPGAPPALPSASPTPAPALKAKPQAPVSTARVAQTSAPQTPQTSKPSARVEGVKLENSASPVAATRLAEQPKLQATPTSTISPPTMAGPTVAARGDETPRSANGSLTRKDQKVAGLEASASRPLHREEMLRELVSPWTRPQSTPLEAQTSGQSEGGSGGGAGGGGGHHQGGSGGGSEGGGRGQSGEELQLELDWLGGADDALAFSVELRDVQFRPRTRIDVDSELELPNRRTRRDEADEQGEQQSPPRHRRRRWEEEEEDDQKAPLDQSDCAPARLICRPDAEFVAVARHWLSRPPLRHFTQICPGEVSSMGIIRLRDFPLFESGHQRLG